MSFGSFVLLPNITGSFNGNALNAINNGTSVVFMQGAFWLDKLHSTQGVYQGGNISNSIGFDASRTNSIYGNSTTVQPRSLVFNYVIKY